MGTPDFAQCILEALNSESGGIAAVVTQPDRPQGRGNKMIPSPVKKYAQEHRIPVLQPERAEELVKDLRQFEADFIVVAAFGQILKPVILEIPARACINVHASLLPKYRGASPVNAAIIEGDDTTGVTTIIMNEGLDTGDILLAQEVAIETDDTAETLHDRLALAGAGLCVRTLLEFDSITPVKQDDSIARYTKRMKKYDGLIDWSQPSDRIRNLIRGCTPWPGSFSYHEGKMIKIWKADVKDNAVESAAAPGTVTHADSSGILIATGTGQLLITEVQLEGRKKQDVETFLRGYPISKGNTFTGNAE